MSDNKTVDERSDIDRLVDAGDVQGLNTLLAEEAKKAGVDVKRNDKGQFVKVEEAKTEDTVDDNEEVEYYQVVDLGNGKSVKITGASEEEVTAKAEHAQSIAALFGNKEEAKKEEPKVEAKKEITADEKVALELEWKAGKISTDEYMDKSGLLDAQLAKRGFTPEKLAKLDKVLEEDQSKKEANSWESATKRFAAEHPEYTALGLKDGSMEVELFKREVADQMLKNPKFDPTEAIESAYESVVNKGWIKPAELDENGKVTSKSVDSDDEPEVVEVKAPPKKKATSSAIFNTGGSGNARKAAPVAGKKARSLTAEEFSRMSGQELADYYNEQVQ